MKKTLLLVLLAAGVSMYAQSVPDITYDANADMIQLPSFGEVAGVATNSKGHVFVYARTGHGVATLGDERTFYHNGSRIFQFDQSGKFVKEIGQGVYAVNFAQQIRVDPQDNVWIVDSGSAQGHFNGIRGLARDANGNLYVADAGNKRIQVFDGEGAFKSQITNVGTPQAICVSGGSTQYLYSSNSNEPESMERGEIYKVRLTGEVIGKFGRAGKLAKEFGMVNAIDCRTEN